MKTTHEIRTVGLMIPASILCRVISLVTVAVMGMGLLSACTTLEEEEEVQRLPDPAIRLCPPGLARNDAEQARLDESDQFLYDEYLQLWGEDAIVVTNQTPQCAIVDCISLESINESWVAPPPPISPEQLQLPEGVQVQLTELDVFPELQCPANSMAVDRPSFSQYVWGDTGATSLQDWLDNYPEVVGAPGDSEDKHLYAGLYQIVDNVGANVWINSFSGELERNTLSVHEILVGCPDPANQGKLLQWVGFGALRDHLNKDAQGNYGDTALRLAVEFITRGPPKDPKDGSALGAGKGGWHGGRHSRNDFKFEGWRRYGPNATLYAGTISTVGGTQYASRYTIELLDGNWWIAHNDTWLGYYKGELFNNGDSSAIVSRACHVYVYGEVAHRRPKGSTTVTSTDMGGGQFADAGFGNAAGFINPFYRDVFGSYGPLDPAQVQPFDPLSYNPACYRNTPLTPGIGTTVGFFFADGPGFDPNTPGCTY